MEEVNTSSSLDRSQDYRDNYHFWLPIVVLVGAHQVDLAKF